MHFFKTRTKGFLFTFLFTSSLAVQVFSSEKIHFEVEKFQLPNGLTVLMHVDRTIPIVSYQTWFRVGSVDEEVNYTGIAHLFEHMMFKGAKRYSNKMYDQVLRENGATNNAFTTRDYTAYYINLPSSRVELAVDMESDRMESLQINSENLTSEREVVKEERRYRVDNRPVGLLYETLFASVFRTHPYRWPVIGWMKDLGNINVEKCKDFFRKYYAPNNAVVSVAGDFDPSKLKSLIEKYYGKIPSQEITRTKREPESPQKAAKVVSISKKVAGEHLAIGYRTAKAGQKDTYAIDLLTEILGGGTSSRLYKRLIYNSQVADSVSAYQMSMKEDGLVTFFIEMKSGKSFDQATKIVLGELWRSRNQKYDEKEVEKAKNSVLVSYVDSLKSSYGKAYALGLNEVLMGSYEFLFKDIDIYLSVTPEMIQEVAEKYFQPWQATQVQLKSAL
ncbi:MAG: insulinase family protein [Bdellovibrionales bacterium]|nr:insulinase family protein [Bdellovibrionales bacterium]